MPASASLNINPAAFLQALNALSKILIKKRLIKTLSNTNNAAIN
jgi:mannitol/fructose-specific phosphotransferase system IIA component (Ntr-type)